MHVLQLLLLIQIALDLHHGMVHGWYTASSACCSLTVRFEFHVWTVLAFAQSIGILCGNLRGIRCVLFVLGDHLGFEEGYLGGLLRECVCGRLFDCRRDGYSALDACGVIRSTSSQSGRLVGLLAGLAAPITGTWQLGRLFGSECSWRLLGHDWHGWVGSHTDFVMLLLRFLIKCTRWLATPG